jgi:hypothetical protein
MIGAVLVAFLGSTSCGTDAACILKAAEACAPARWSAEPVGAVDDKGKMVTHLRIVGHSGGDCEIQWQTVWASLFKFDWASAEKYIGRTLSERERVQSAKDLMFGMNRPENTANTCTLPTKTLVDNLRRFFKNNVPFNCEFKRLSPAALAALATDPIIDPNLPQANLPQDQAAAATPAVKRVECAKKPPVGRGCRVGPCQADVRVLECVGAHREKRRCELDAHVEAEVDPGCVLTCPRTGALPEISCP